MRVYKALAVTALAATLLTACAGAPKEAQVGEVLEVELSGSKVDASAEFAVTGVDQHAVAELADELRLSESYDGGTVFLLHYDVRITDGELPADEGAMSFRADVWGATGADEVEIAPVRILHKIDIDGCQLLTQEVADSLAGGEQVSACMIFVAAEADASMESVTYGVPMVNHRRARSGWTWLFD